MIWWVALLPVIGGAVVWLVGQRGGRPAVGAAAATVLGATVAASIWAAVARPRGSYRWGAGLTLHAAVGDVGAVMLVLVPTVALVVVVYAAAHEGERGLPRLVALLVAFTGAMQLLVLADDLLTLLIAWELVGACSWALIAHDWWERDKPARAAHAFLVTRFGDLGLFAAVGAAAAGTGSLRYADLTRLHGGWSTVFVAGIVLAAMAKSAQVPFSPWLFSAMAGPTSASALLHAATMVAAGAYLLIRLQPVLDAASWFGPTVLTVGLVTALAGGIVAALQRHAKRLLAASTSAQYGLMLVAVGAGFPAAALALLVVHAVFKAGLFLAAGIAIEAVDSPDLADMRLGRDLRVAAAASAVLALALAAVPPLGAAWAKETIVAAAGDQHALLAMGVAIAGALTAWYSARFQLLAFGPSTSPRARPLARRPGSVEVGAVVVTAVASVGLGVIWLPGARAVVASLAGSSVPEGTAWEAVLSIALVLGVLVAAVSRFRAGRLLGPSLHGTRAATADWFAIPSVTARVVADPSLRVATALATFDRVVLDAPPRAVAAFATRSSDALARIDDRVVDAGTRVVARFARFVARTTNRATEPVVDGSVRGVAQLVGGAGRETRRLHTGRAHQYYVIVAAGLVVLIAVAALASWGR
jgi:NADH:ubiquinone oxidoreductase subunit 5 (subunit L)/multisubunit Na+/H+ antiporter MnhA subunit